MCFQQFLDKTDEIQKALIRTVGLSKRAGTRT